MKKIIGAILAGILITGSLTAEERIAIEQEQGQREPTRFENDFLGELRKLSGDRLHRLELEELPDYYAFYFSALWCPPCRNFTPKLVDFYDKQKENGETRFEIIFVSSDRDEASMITYMRDYKMGFPALAYGRFNRLPSRVQDVKIGRGIPNLVVVNSEGEVLSSSYVDDKYRGPVVVMNELAGLLAVE